jgi:hypothetical protein
MAWAQTGHIEHRVDKDARGCEAVTIFKAPFVNHATSERAA